MDAKVSTAVWFNLQSDSVAFHVCELVLFCGCEFVIFCYFILEMKKDCGFPCSMNCC